DMVVDVDIDCTSMRSTVPRVRYDVQRLAEDIAGRGWSIEQAAFKAGVSFRTVYRFLYGEFQTVRTIRLMAKALGTRVDTYILRDSDTQSRSEA
ncbi:MAG: helix-turn-helix domain-containing protein, partial [Burkholderiales bacterium]|nr:helix-turn-helix domain-containing protein [Burkholderiales bacterium]